MVFQIVRNSTPQYSWTAKFRNHPSLARGYSDTWQRCHQAHGGRFTDDNKVTNNRIDCFLIFLKIIEFHLINIVLDLFDGIKDICNAMLP